MDKIQIQIDWSKWCHHIALCTIHLSVIIFLSEFLSQRPMIAWFFCRAELVVSSQSPGLAFCIVYSVSLPGPAGAILLRPVCLGQACAQRCQICEYFKHTNISTYSHSHICQCKPWSESRNFLLWAWKILLFMINYKWVNKNIDEILCFLKVKL